MSVPIPQVKPTNLGSSGGSFLDSVFSTVTNVFNKGIETVGNVWEAEQLVKIRQAEATGEIVRQQALSTPTAYTAPALSSGQTLPQMAAVGLLAVGALLIAK